VAESFKPDITNAEKLHSPLNLPRRDPEIKAGAKTLTQLHGKCFYRQFVECPSSGNRREKVLHSTPKNKKHGVAYRAKVSGVECFTQKVG
jgi:hypothetical protein